MDGQVEGLAAFADTVVEAVEAKCLAVRRVKMDDLKRIAKATGGEVVTTLANLEGEEEFDANALGEAERYVQVIAKNVKESLECRRFIKMGSKWKIQY